MTVSEILEKAAEIVEQWGWRQGWSDHTNEGSPVCAAEAIHWAADSLNYPDTTTCDLVCHPFDRRLGKPIPDWNDAPERTKEEVVTALRNAARAA